MAVEEALTGWVELVSSTKLTRLDDITATLKKLADDNKNLEIIKLDVEDGALSHADFTCWEEPAPNFAGLFKPLVDLLELEEFMYFEEKVKFGHRGRTLRAILVSGVGVFKAEQDALILLLQERNSALEANDDDEDEDFDDEFEDEDGDGVSDPEACA